MPSSQDIKAWLVERFSAQGRPSLERDWRRTKKHKDAEGRVRRVFEHPALGTVAVLETPEGLALDGPSAPSAALSSAFTCPTWSPTSVAAAERLMAAMRAGEVHSEDLEDHPNYLDGYAALPGQFAFRFPSDTYDNDYDDGMTLQDGMGDLCIEVADRGDADPDQYLPHAIEDRLTSIGLCSLDEYHWGLADGEGKGFVSIEDMVGRLLGLGLVYTGEGCMLAPDLVPAGATRPTPQPELEDVQPLKHALFAALKSDDVVAVHGLFQDARPPMLLDVGNGRTWVQAAYDAKAFQSLNLLLACGAPVAAPNDTREWFGGDGTMNYRWREMPDTNKAFLRLLAAASGWDPERPVTTHYFSEGERARDEWAQSAWEGMKPRDSWLDEAWDTLAGRVGTEAADESFVHAWCMRAFVSPRTRKIPDRVAAALEANPALLDAWPSRTAPVAGQAFLKWCSSATSAPVALELGKRLGVYLPSLGPMGRQGKTLLEWAKDEQKAALDAVRRERASSQHGMFMVMQYPDGRQVTLEQEYQGTWNEAMALQKALEEWPRGPSGRKPGP